MESRRLVSYATSAVLFSMLAAWPAQAQKKSEKIDPATLMNVEVQAIPDDPFDPVNELKVPGVKATEPLKVRRGQIVKIILTGTPKTGYHTYPLTTRTSSQPKGTVSQWEIGKAQGITPLWPVTETEPVKHREDTLGTYFEHPKTFTWAQDIFVSADAPPGKLIIPLKLETQVCKGSCFPYVRNDEVALVVTDEAPMNIPDSVKGRLLEKKPAIIVYPIPGEKPADADAPPAPVARQGAARPAGGGESVIIPEGLIKDTHEEYKAKIEAIAKQINEIGKEKAAGDSGDLLSFILAGIFWGAISLITPCVFPMIPITVSFFLKQSEKEHHRPIMMATVYSLTIVIVLTLAAATLITTFSVLSTRPWMNYILGGLFVFFALSLFGMYEIELPSSLAQFTSAREGQGGFIGTIFMALTFTIISFACVAPFLGGFSGTAASERPWEHYLLGGLAFSATFASPFFFLALFPTMLRKLPKSGSWLNSVKVVMGFLELAAAFKFLRGAELIQSLGKPSFFTFDLVLGIWIALCVLCGLYLIGIFRLPHDTPESNITVPRLLFSGAFLGLAFYLAPALFKVNAAGQPQRPGGAVYAWIDAFLLPDSGADQHVHTGNLDYAVSAAREERKRTGLPKRIFVDFTGVNCANCSMNEQNVFSKPTVAKLFEPYIMVKVYLDTVPAKYYAPNIQAELAANPGRAKADAVDVNFVLQRDTFHDVQRPLYAILEPDLGNHIQVIGVYDEGLINDEAAFAEFLKNNSK